jgi:ABC-type sugar transport system ATPase subunit
MIQNTLIEIRNISKSFPGVKALKNVSLDIYSGEVHVLIGENGAGKSTLIKIITGIYQNDSGEIRLKGKLVHFTNPKQAIKAGISVIHQELSLIPDLTVADNMFLGREVAKGKFLEKKVMNQRTQEIFSSLDLDINPEEKIRNLSTAKKQMVEIARSVSWNSSLVIMDEPTSSLAEHEVNSLFKIIRKLRSENVGIIYISHRLQEIPEIGDKITVLRDGILVKTLPVNETNENKLVSLMVGRQINNYYHRENKKTGKIILKIESITRKPHFKDISFCLREREILGIAGLIGAGRTELLRSIFGVDKIESGSIFLHGQLIDFNHPIQAIHNKIGLVPEERRDQGLLLNKSVKENVSLPSINIRAKKGFIDKLWEIKVTEEYKKKLQVKTPSIGTIIEFLSGGNQQKVIIARWLAADSKILLLDEPTRGIDVNAKAEIYHLMNDFTKSGGSILMVSSELLEILGIADRIIVMREGMIAGILDHKEASEEKIMTLAALDE